jgi:ubiquinone/menaquinone biosynthesis C-methylase UbiE
VNRLENWFCASSYWHRLTKKELLPWLLSGAELGEHVLEIGAGPGAATEELRKRARRVTSLELNYRFAVGIRRRSQNANGTVVQGDASALPFAEKTFSAAIAVLVLHHLGTREAQERAFAEVFRILRPGGVFLAVEIPDRWLHRIVHIQSTFLPVAADSAPVRLAAAGLSDPSVDFLRGAYRLRARRARDASGQ